MKTLKKFKKNAMESISFFDVNPELPSAMTTNSITSSLPEEEIAGPGSSNDDDDSSWYNESAI